MKKKGLIVAIVVILVLGVLAAIFLPKRIKLYNAVKDNIETLGPEGAMFANYDVTDDTLTKVENDNISIAIPSGYVYEDREVVEMYMSVDGNTSVSLTREANNTEASFFKAEYGDESEVCGVEYKLDDLKNGYEKLGYGIPDSTYNTYKCLYLLKESDYSFWDYERGLAYLNAAYVKNELFWMDTNYIYERDNMYALIMERYLEDEGMYYYYIDVYNPKNLNQSYNVIIRVKDRQQAYAIINSIELK